ncbi:MAG: acetyltransferase [Anaerocolumna sp.]|jgi:ribosomal-protein-alanine N-acetyltransferase|nr:acetyltransferase [Anaerocolumna sp.]
MLTERLLIRDIERADFKDICEYGCDEETGQYMIYWPKTKEQINEFIDTCIKAKDSDPISWYEFAIQLQDNKKVIGNISINLKENVAEIGWISNKLYWNKGYMSEAVGAVIKYAFNNLNIKQLIATCTDKNFASYKLMEKCGMVRIKTENNHKASRQGVEVTYNKFTYSISKPLD